MCPGVRGKGRREHVEGGTKSMETGELQPAHASVNRISAITQPRLFLQKLLPQKRQAWT